MRSGATLLYVVPAACWPGSPSGDCGVLEPLRESLEELAVIETRVRKRVQLEPERQRLAQALTRLYDRLRPHAVAIESARQVRAALSAGRIPMLRLGPAYVDLLYRERRQRDMSAPTSVEGACIPPDRLRAHLKRVDELVSLHGYAKEPAIRSRLRLLRRLVSPWVEHECGVIDALDALDDQDLPPRVNGVPVPRWEQPSSVLLRVWESCFGPHRVDPPDVTVRPNRDGVSWQRRAARGAVRGEQLEQLFEEQVRHALVGNGAVTINVRHEVLTTVLQRHLVAPEGDGRRSVRVLYSDGSEATPFPLGCLSRVRSDWTPGLELGVALMSMRHLEIDAHVDFCWYRNIEVPSQRGLSQADEWCLEYSRKELSDLRTLAKGRRVLLRLYHTGFEPALLGFYRALVEQLSAVPSADPWIRVVPMIKNESTRTGFKQTRAWPE